MPAFTNIPNALVAVGAKPFATTIQSLRDNPIAIAEGDPTAPVNTAEWHPFNKVINNDANDGRIWSFPVDGNVTAITTPDFADGWEYALLIDQLRSSVTAPSTSLNLNLFRQTSGAYGGALAVSGAINSTTGGITGWIEIPHVRKIRRSHYALFQTPTDSADAAALVALSSRATWNHSTAQKILRAQLTLPGSGVQITGSGSTGAVFLYRRKDSGAQ